MLESVPRNAFSRFGSLFGLQFAVWKPFVKSMLHMLCQSSHSAEAVPRHGG